MSTTTQESQKTERGTGTDALRIYGLSVFGAPFDRSSWSGSSHSLFSCLRDYGVLTGAVSVDLQPMQKALSGLRNLSFDRRRLYLDIMKSRFSFDLRSRNADDRLSSAPADTNAVLQISALLLPKREPGKIYCSYHDGNTAVSRDPRFSFMAAASQRVMAESWRYEQAFYKQMDLVFTMSEWLRRSMISDFGASEESVVTAGAGVNLSYFDELLATDIDRDWSAKRILFVGTNFAFKGGPQLLAAFRNVRRVYPGATLQIVGCEPEFHEPGVEVIGILDKRNVADEQKLRSLFESATLFVLPTLYDAFGIAFVEAMYHRLPCIGSDRCAVPEIIRHGETGFVIDPEDPRAIEKRILELFGDERLSKDFGQAGYASAKARFSWDIVCQRMIAAMKAKRARA